MCLPCMPRSPKLKDVCEPHAVRATAEPTIQEAHLHHHPHLLLVRCWRCSSNRSYEPYMPTCIWTFLSCQQPVWLPVYNGAYLCLFAENTERALVPVALIPVASVGKAQVCPKPFSPQVSNLLCCFWAPGILAEPSASVPIVRPLTPLDIPSLHINCLMHRTLTQYVLFSVVSCCIRLPIGCLNSCSAYPTCALTPVCV